MPLPHLIDTTLIIYLYIKIFYCAYFREKCFLSFVLVMKTQLYFVNHFQNDREKSSAEESSEDESESEDESGSESGKSKKEDNATKQKHRKVRKLCYTIKDDLY